MLYSGADFKRLSHLISLFCTYDWLCSLHSIMQSNWWHKHHACQKRHFILLLLLLSGNVQPNPGPDPVCLNTPSDFKARSGLGIAHINIRSLLPKLDFVKIWVKSSDPDILVLSETWLNNSVSDKDIAVKGYSVFRCDRPRKGGGVAIYIKKQISCCPSFFSLSEQAIGTPCIEGRTFKGPFYHCSGLL